MGIIRCTKILLSELEIKPDDDAGQSVGINNWHANLLWIQRRKCVLFTNDQTLYTFLVTGLKKQEFENFHQIFRLNLFKNISSEDLTQKQIDYLFSEHREIQISKTNNRSVLGSLNEYTYQVKWLIHDMGGLDNINQALINRELNRIPMGAIDYSNGIEELHKALNQIGV